MTRYTAPIVLTLLAALSAGAAAQFPTAAPARMNDFFEFRGTWILEAGDGEDLPAPVERLSALGIPRQLVITTTTSAFSVAKDGREPEIYTLDGSEVQERDARTGAGIDRFYRLTLVGDAVALTIRRPSGTPDRRTAQIITDAYTVAGRLLTIERRVSTTISPPGGIVFSQHSPLLRSTITYRRTEPAGGARP